MKQTPDAPVKFGACDFGFGEHHQLVLGSLAYITGLAEPKLQP